MKAVDRKDFDRIAAAGRDELVASVFSAVLVPVLLAGIILPEKP